MKNYLITYQNNGKESQIIMSEYAETLVRQKLYKLLKKQGKLKDFGIINVKEVIAQDFDEYYNV
jgi:hypothetical protein